MTDYDDWKTDPEWDVRKKRPERDPDDARDAQVDDEIGAARVPDDGKGDSP